VKIDPVARPENSLTVLPSSGQRIRLAAGEVVRGEVLSVREDGLLSLRVTTESGRSAVFGARTDIPLDPGESVVLKVVGGEREIALRFLGMAGEEGTAPEGSSGLPEAYRELASELAASRLPAAGVRQAEATFRILPDAVKEAVPGFPTLEGSPGMESLDGAALRGAVEGSGVLFETKLKLSAGEPPAGNRAGAAQSPDTKGTGPGGDRKEALLRLGEVLRDRNAAALVRAAGGSPGEAAVRAEGLLSTIESYQLASSAHGVLYAPLPLDWEELVDGELLFRKRARGKGESYTCEIHLDLRPLGKMSVSVTMYDGAFFLSLSPESETARSLISSRSDEVGKRFREAGLPLKAVSVHRKRSVTFGVPSGDGVDLEV